KVSAGADFIQTQPVFDADSFQKWMNRVEKAGLLDRIPILAGVAALKSLKMAEYLKDRVAGFNIPDNILDRLKSVPEENQQSEGIQICIEQIKGVRGIHIMSISSEEKIPEIIEQAGLPSIQE
ncbi:methylenetetrahydrofolate reductase, partial [Thermodesulfobacteriota bacterium]